MKKLFLLSVAIGMMLTVHAQKTEKQMATLQHGSQTKVYYGSDALINAYFAAADSGDVITLSSGEFNWESYNLSIYIYLNHLLLLVQALRMMNIQA